MYVNCLFGILFNAVVMNDGRIRRFKININRLLYSVVYFFLHPRCVAVTHVQFGGRLEIDRDGLDVAA